jgi:hypothetical protein
MMEFSIAGTLTSIAFGVLLAATLLNGIVALFDPKKWLYSEWTLSTPSTRAWFERCGQPWEVRVLGLVFVIAGFYIGRLWMVWPV